VELGTILEALPGVSDPNVLIGPNTRDDAGVYRISEDRALLATVDFFTPIVDDARAFGAIAAANSVSDVYAMGGRPLFALSLVAFPREKLGSGLLEEIVRGGASKLQEAGVPVLGGHSVDDPEPKFGYAVIGEVDPRRMLTHRGGRPGDFIYLTKPLGLGLIATAVKRGLCPPEVEAEAVRVMTHLNRDASRAMVEAGATAATDITGYGLVGHLLNLEGGAEIELDRVPFIQGVHELAQLDLFPAGSRRNREAFAQSVDWGGVGELNELLLSDAQTSGGLLVTLPPERAEQFERALAGEPYRAACIGRVSTGRVRVLS
jgi:selenide,water dikinase